MGVEVIRAEKDRLRKQLRADRSDIDVATSNAIVSALRLFLDSKSGMFLFYRSMSHEPNLESLAATIGWESFLITRTPSSGPLSVHSATTPLEKHRYGFFQPVEGSPEVPVNRISVALVPALAFDTAGNRLGNGLGLYDELLARLEKNCLRVGVTAQRYVLDGLPSETHDVAMTHLATEDGVISV